jgi:hypothetical protein
MTSVKCLFIDDNANDLTNFSFLLMEAWESLGTGFQLEVVPKATYDEGLQEIRASGYTYKIFVIDWFYKIDGEEKPRGRILIQQVQKHAPTAAVVVLTAVPAAKFTAADLLGVDASVAKDDVEQGGETVLAEALAKAWVKVDSAPPDDANVAVSGDSLALREIVERVGKGRLSVLLQRLNKSQPEKIVMKYVAPGFSGAAVLRADMTLKSGAKQVLLKIARDRDKLDRERLRRDDTALFPPGTFIPADPIAPVESGGWFAIQAGFSVDAQTLLESVTSGTIVGSVLGSLTDTLSRVKKNTTTRVDQPVLVAYEAILPLSRRARAENAAVELVRLAEKYAAHPVYDAALELIRHGLQLPDVAGERIQPSTFRCLSHGDLHARNILVDSRDVPLLIDASEIGHLPWPADLARLLVDLFLSGWSFGVESHDWAALNDWHTSFVRLMKEQDFVVGDANKVVAHVVKTLRAAVFQIHSDIDSRRAWEFWLAVALELIRSTYRIDLPAPKRVLALLAADTMLREGAAAFDAAGIAAV